jgi:hypothetical protein
VKLNKKRFTLMKKNPKIFHRAGGTGRGHGENFILA